MWLRSVTFCLALAACSSPEIYGSRYDVYIDPAFAPAEDALIRTSLAAWCARVPELELSYRSGTCDRQSSPTGTICIHRSDQAGVLQHIGRPSAGPGLVWDATTRRESDDASDIWLAMDTVDDTTGGRLGRNIEHEVGHAFGLEHTEGPSVMYWNCDEQGSSPDVTRIDVDQFRYLRARSSATPRYFH